MCGEREGPGGVECRRSKPRIARKQGDYFGFDGPGYSAKRFRHPCREARLREGRWLDAREQDARAEL
jgi:hypothetical protein